MQLLEADNAPFQKQGGYELSSPDLNRRTGSPGWPLNSIKRRRTRAFKRRQLSHRNPTKGNTAPTLRIRIRIRVRVFCPSGLFCLGGYHAQFRRPQDRHT
ncbi:hypothetical protein CKAH01_00991 [Colletotrichum kahawae]|uniref:Uncharacterized protein n=1 Tax=Colletotrichum kahawae TaxID=34407 RepID=A0AAD9YLI3_COLKA|nr:hypothetical protein CKAH01_00991 [Colletotrichum kahawae]